MTLRPKLMTGTALDATEKAVTHLLACDLKFGEIEPSHARWLEKLLAESRAEQAARRAIAGSERTPYEPRPDGADGQQHQGDNPADGADVDEHQGDNPADGADVDERQAHAC